MENREFIPNFDVLRSEALRLSKKKCCNCGSSNRLIVQPIIPIEAGGNFHIDNLCVLCHTCYSNNEAYFRSRAVDEEGDPMIRFIS